MMCGYVPLIFQLHLKLSLHSLRIWYIRLNCVDDADILGWRVKRLERRKGRAVRRRRLSNHNETSVTLQLLTIHSIELE